MNTQKPIFTIINHIARINLGLSLTEYCVADSIYHLSNNPKNEKEGWCYMTQENMGVILNLSRKAITKIEKRLEEKGLIEKRGHLKRTTSLWYDTVIIFNENDKREQSTLFEKDKKGTKVTLKREQSTLYNNRYNNNIDLLDKSNKSYLSKDDKSDKNKEPENKTKYTPEFEEFWREYPPRGSKFHAFQEWQKIEPDKELKEEIIKAVQNNKNHETWDDPKYIPHAAMYLKRRRWEDILYQAKYKNKFNKVEVSSDKYKNIGTRFNI